MRGINFKLMTQRRSLWKQYFCFIVIFGMIMENDLRNFYVV